jgi:hypothetical protein
MRTGMNGIAGSTRRLPDYQPSFAIDHIEPAAGELLKLDWLSFQGVSRTERPVRDIRALQYTPNLDSLILPLRCFKWANRTGV